jgi:hypothetical protein
MLGEDKSKLLSARAQALVELEQQMHPSAVEIRGPAEVEDYLANVCWKLSVHRRFDLEAAMEVDIALDLDHHDCGVLNGSPVHARLHPELLLGLSAAVRRVSHGFPTRFLPIP